MQRDLVQQKAAPFGFQQLQPVARTWRQQRALGRPMENLRRRVGLQQPALQAFVADTCRTRPEDLFQFCLVEQDPQSCIVLVAEYGKLGENAETDLQGTNDRAVRAVASA